jgi:hypothetical protein
MDTRRRHHVALILSCMLLAAAAALAASWARPAPADAMGPGLMFWSRIYSPTANNDSYAEIAKGPHGAVYACGWTNDDWADSGDLLVVKYSSSGVRKWARTWNGADSKADWASDCAVDRFGNLYVTGTTVTAAHKNDWVTVKYSPAGVQLWSKTYDGPANDEDRPSDVVVDSAGNAYVCGGSTMPFGQLDNFHVIKYAASDGTALWETTYAFAMDVVDFPMGMVIDSHRNTYIAGYTFTSALPGASSNIALLKLGPAGGVKWHRTQDGKKHSSDSAQAIALGPNGTLYLAADSGPGPDGVDLMLTKYTTGGTRKWTRYYNAKGNKGDWTDGLAVDKHGTAWVAGVSNISGGPFAQKAILVKWNAGGARNWARVYHTASRGAGWEAVVCDGSGHVWVAGHVYKPGPERDWLIIRYEPNGKRRWLRSWGTVGGDDSCDALVLVGASFLYAGGSIGVPATNDDAVLQKYAR